MVVDIDKEMAKIAARLQKFNVYKDKTPKQLSKENREKLLEIANEIMATFKELEDLGFDTLIEDKHLDPIDIYRLNSARSDREYWRKIVQKEGKKTPWFYRFNNTSTLKNLFLNLALNFGVAKNTIESIKEEKLIEAAKRKGRLIPRYVR